MNKERKKFYINEFIKRGLIFSGFGPIILAVIYLILNYTITDFSLTGAEVFTAVVSIYILAFIVSGASVFNQIEEWSLLKSLLFHSITLYLTYLGCYLLNTWIPFKIEIVLIFTLVFVVTYAVIYLIVVLTIKTMSKKFNKNLNN